VSVDNKLDLNKRKELLGVGEVSSYVPGHFH
jgi:hypothetical protein